MSTTEPTTDLVTTSGRTGVLHHKPTCKRVKPDQLVGSPATYLNGKACGFCSAAKPLAAFRVAQLSAQAKTPEFAAAKADAASSEKARRAKAAKPEASKTPAGGATVTLPSVLVRDAVSAALAVHLPKGSASTVEDGDGPLYVAPDEVTAVAEAITAHMKAILREDRSGNMYREGKLRLVRETLLGLFPEARPAKLTKESKESVAKRSVAEYMEATKAWKAEKAARAAQGAKRKAS